MLKIFISYSIELVSRKHIHKFCVELKEGENISHGILQMSLNIDLISGNGQGRSLSRI